MEIVSKSPPPPHTHTQTTLLACDVVSDETRTPDPASPGVSVSLGPVSTPAAQRAFSYGRRRLGREWRTVPRFKDNKGGGNSPGSVQKGGASSSLHPDKTSRNMDLSLIQNLI